MKNRRKALDVTERHEDGSPHLAVTQLLRACGRLFSFRLNIFVSLGKNYRHIGIFLSELKTSNLSIVLPKDWRIIAKEDLLK